MFPHRTDGWPESISTGDSVGAPIYVAQDEIYVGSAPFSLAQAMETLIYGLSEHHTKAAEVVTPLAQRLGRLVSQNVSSVDEAALGQQQIRALIWNFQPYPAQIAIVDTQRQLEVTGLITRALICPTGFEPTPDFHLYNTVWGDLPPWDAHNQVQPLDLISDITFQCLSRSSSLIFTASLSIVIYFEPFQNGVIHRDPNWRSLGGLELRLSAEPTESNPEVIITNVRPLNAEDH